MYNTQAAAQRRWPFLVLLFAGIGLLVAGVGLIAAGLLSVRSSALATGIQLPDKLGESKATSVSRGQAALSEIESLHGKGFELTDGAVAHYDEATVWVARTRDEQAAAAMTASMRDRIAEGSSPFTPTGTRQTAGGLVHELTGMGQAHFYWQAGDKVVWLAAPPAEAEQDLAELLASIR